MLIAALLFFLALFFVALLHCLVRFTRFPPENGREIRRSSVLDVPLLLGARLLILRHLSTIDSRSTREVGNDLIKGLEPCVVSSIPLFVFGQDEEDDCGLECVICLSLFENGEEGRRLGLCRHAFHVECIDMWLHSHTTCPVCRAPAVKVCAAERNHEIDLNEQNLGELFEMMRVGNEDHGRLEIVVEDPNQEGSVEL